MPPLSVDQPLQLPTQERTLGQGVGGLVNVESFPTAIGAKKNQGPMNVEDEAKCFKKSWPLAFNQQSI